MPAESRELGIKLLCISKTKDEVVKTPERMKSSENLFRVKASEKMIALSNKANKHISQSQSTLCKLKQIDSFTSIVKSNFESKSFHYDLDYGHGTKFILEFNQNILDEGNQSSSDESSFINEYDLKPKKSNKKQNLLSNSKIPGQGLSSTKDTKTFKEQITADHNNSLSNKSDNNDKYTNLS